MDVEVKNKQFLTPQEVSDRYGNRISTRTLSNWRSSGLSGPPYTKIGGSVLYPLSKLIEWESGNTVNNTSQYRNTSGAIK